MPIDTKPQFVPKDINLWPPTTLCRFSYGNGVAYVNEVSLRRAGLVDG